MKPTSIPIKYIVFSLIVVAIFVVLGVQIFGLISQVEAKIAAAQGEATVLRERIDTLKSVTEVVDNNATIAASAVPSEDSSVPALSVLRFLAVTHGVILDQIRFEFSPSQTEDLSYSDIILEANGTNEDINEFIDEIKRAMPLFNIIKMDLSNRDAFFVAEMTIRTFWAPYPTTLPSISQPLNMLSSEDNALLEQLGGFNVFEGTDSGTVQDTEEVNDNPFGN